MKFTLERARTFFRRTLLRQAVLTNSALLMAALTSLTTLVAVTLQRSFENQTELRAVSIAELLACHGRAAVLGADRDELATLARNAISTEDVLYVRITDRAGSATQFGRSGFPVSEVPGLVGDAASFDHIRKYRAPTAEQNIIEAVWTVRAGGRVAEEPAAMQSGAPVGTIQVGLSTERSRQLILHMARYAAGGAGMVILLVAFLHLLYLRRLLLPLKQLLGFARRVSRGDLTPAPPVERPDELGELAGALNQMAEETRELQDMVAERSRELQDETTEKERARRELDEVRQRFIDLSRQCGMAEAATGVLHNVGNVLNSLNVSANIVAGRITDLRVDRLQTTIDMLREHESDLTGYLRDDPKGARLLPYLEKLGKHLGEERQAVLVEVEALRDHVNHITEIVAAQQECAKVSGAVKDVNLPNLVEDALRIVRNGLEQLGIRIERQFEEVPPIPADKHRILEILVNLLRNAKQAIKESANSPRVICLRIRRNGAEGVLIEVNDSGVGLARENLTRIFTHGFTTKQDGHGFGLHSSALAARAIGGSLWAESDGPGLGSTFILRLPLRSAAQAEKGELHEIAGTH